MQGQSKMQKIIAYVLLVLAGLTSCAPAVPIQPIITYTPANTTVPPPVITPAANATIIITPNVTGTTIVTNNTVTNQTTMPANNTASVPVTPDYPNPGGLAQFKNTPYFDSQNSVNLTAGEAKSIEVALVTNNNGPAEFSVVFLGTSTNGPYVGGHTLSMPNGLQVSVEPPVMAYPNNTYNLAIAINTSAELAPGGYWLQFNFNFENLMQASPWMLVTVAPPLK
jgi:hypothetical protein